MAFKLNRLLVKSGREPANRPFHFPAKDGHGESFGSIGAVHPRRKRRLHRHQHHVFHRLRKTKRVNRARHLGIRRINTFQAED